MSCLKGVHTKGCTDLDNRTPAGILPGMHSALLTSDCVGQGPDRPALGLNVNR